MTSLLFDDVLEEPEFKKSSPGANNMQKTRDLFDSVESEYKPETQALFDSLEEHPSTENSALTPAKASFFEKVKNYFTSDKFGEALSFQMRSGGPAGAPSLSPQQGKKVATEFATIAAVEAAFAPVVGAAAASAFAPRVLTSLARLTQAGTAGAATATTSKLVDTGEFPSREELLEHGLDWVAIDALLQGLHLGASGGKVAYDFGAAVKKIAREESVPATKVLGDLWTASKNYIKTKFGRTISTPEDITPGDVEVLVDKVKAAEKEGLPPDVEIDISKKKPQEIAFEENPKERITEPKEPQEIPGELQKKPTFTTSKGSIYQVNADGGTTRVKVARSEHPGEEGLQPASEKTWFVTPEESLKLSEFQTSGERKAIVELPNGQLGVQYLTGDNAGKIEQRTLVDFAREPEEGMIPIESWDNGKRIHFGNAITKIEGEFVAEELPKRPTQAPPNQTRPKQPIMGTKQAVARSRILEMFRTAFNDPIRLGKIKQRNAAGIHKLWPKVTRLLEDNDVETAAHEIGHNLHTTLYGGDAATPQAQAKNIEAALQPYLGELKPLAHYAPWGMEGFAEFTRLYVTNPSVARELAPKFYAKFEADLEAQYPEMKNALLQAREYYDAYLQGTPQSRIRAQTSYGSDKGKLANIVDSVKKNLEPDFLKTQFLDDVFPAKRLVAEVFGIPLSEVENLKDERNLYRSLRVLKGAVGKGDVFVLHEAFNAKTLKKTGGSLKDILKQLPDEESYREFNDYLIARRTTEKSLQNITTGINIGDALAVEKDLKGKYGDLAEQLDRYNDSLLNYAKDAGLLSDEQYAMIKKNNMLYVPFQRVMETEKGGGASGAGKLQAGKPIKRMKGSTRDIIAPIESILKNTYSIILNAEKNLAGQVLAKIAKMKSAGAYVEAVPTPIKLKGKVEGEQVASDLAKRFEREGLDELIEYDENGKPALRADIAEAIPEVFLRFGAGHYPAGENIVTVYFDGKPKYYEVTPELFEMWNKGIAPYTANLLTKVLRMPARTLRAGAILNPKFIQKNVIRDTWGSWLFTKYGKSVTDPIGLFMDTVYSPLEMLAASAMKRTLYIEWMKAGGGMSTMQSLDRDAVTKKLEEVRQGYKPHQVVKWLRHVAEIGEEANRLSEFGKALKFEGNTRLGAEIAAFASRDLSIDFAKMGLQTKALNQIIPFWNATVQGGDKFLRTLANPEDRKNFLPRVLGFIILPSLILAWLNKDDERVKEFYEEEKDFNFITFVGDRAIKIPVPFEVGVISHGLTQRMFDYFMKNDPNAFEEFMGSVLSAMLPNFIPTIANPFIEAYANKNFFTGAPIVPKNQVELISKYQYKRGTSSTARLLGRAMTYMLGQETRAQAASPAIIDHFINSWTGGLGRLMINVSDASLEAAGLSDKIPGPQQTITVRLGLDAFTTRYPRANARSIEKFYDYYADATSRMKSFKHAEKMDLETVEGQEAAYKRFDKIYDYPTLQASYKAIQACQREINNIWNDPSLDAELKQQMVDDLYLEQIVFAKAANEDIRKHRLTQKD